MNKLMRFDLDMKAAWTSVTSVSVTVNFPRQYGFYQLLLIMGLMIRYKKMLVCMTKQTRTNLPLWSRPENLTVSDDTEWKAGYNLDRLPVVTGSQKHKQPHTLTLTLTLTLRVNLESAIKLKCMFFDSGRKPEKLKGTHTCTGRTYSSILKMKVFSSTLHKAFTTNCDRKFFSSLLDLVVR